MKNGIIQNIIEFLEFLQREDSCPKNRTIIKIVYSTNSRENIDRMVELCKDGKYILEKEKESEITVGEKSDGTANLMTRITDGTFSITIKGIQFLEEHKKTKRDEEHTKISNFLAAELVITTIAILFHSTKLISPKLLVIIYTIFSILLLIYFKKFKEVKL